MIAENNRKVKSKRTKWARLKKQSEEIANRIFRLGFKERGAAMMNCSTFIVSKTCTKCGDEHLSTAMLCRDRLCPLCAWRLSWRRFCEMNNVINALRPRFLAEGAKATMLTLTLRNCEVDELSRTITTMSTAWHNISRQRIMENVTGWARSLEITYNAETMTFHPHFHILLIWKHDADISSRFQRLITDAWSRALGIDYTAITDHREVYKKIDGEAVTADPTSEDITPAIIECSKYATKPNQFVFMPDDVFVSFINQIKGVRFVSYGRDIRRARRALGYRNEEDADSIDITTEGVQCDCGEDINTMLLKWNGATYDKSSPTEEAGFRKRYLL